ncbi:MAG: peptide-methionine (R)-S-oxide reductase MsrB [Candidatus Eremiobacteraeota bacterium]|nr:peptide-methionine (R)-S-oxide reductase MsrB [Candidatus Eremiobacteraeota bacterium]MBC5828492.1 peptide-methionine (R)-S-oxide reductase MsrB [Candidatus Eremiobacteraeota bacterium]
MTTNIEKTEEQWRSELTPEQYAVLREAATDRPFTGALVHNKAAGTYHCAGCGEELFKSDTKYESHSGWPSFTEPVASGRVELRRDDSLSMRRTEVRCKGCGSHLGHVFDDGPGPSGARYCINSTALGFRAAEDDDRGAD